MSQWRLYLALEMVFCFCLAIIKWPAVPQHYWQNQGIQVSIVFPLNRLKPSENMSENKHLLFLRCNNDRQLDHILMVLGTVSEGDFFCSLSVFCWYCQTPVGAVSPGSQACEFLTYTCDHHMPMQGYWAAISWHRGSSRVCAVPGSRLAERVLVQVEFALRLNCSL